MAYTTFSTDQAAYVLDLGNHIHNRRNLKIFDGIDALVLETGDSTPQRILETHGRLGGNLDLLRYCEVHRIPIYFTDVRPSLTFREDEESFLQYTELFFTPLVLYSSFSKRKTNPFLLPSFSLYNHLLQNPIAEGRDAINARKIEEYVVQDVRQQKPYEQLKIGIHFGAWHMGLKKNLQSKARRDFSIWHQLYSEPRPCFDPSSLNKICVGTYDGTVWRMEEREVSLFLLPYPKVLSKQ